MAAGAHMQPSLMRTNRWNSADSLRSEGPETHAVQPPYLVCVRARKSTPKMTKSTERVWGKWGHTTNGVLLAFNRSSRSPAEGSFTLAHKADLSFFPGFSLPLSPAADLITFYIYRSSRCYFGFETLVTDIGRLHYSEWEHWGPSDRARALLLTLWRRMCRTMCVFACLFPFAHNIRCGLCFSCLHFVTTSSQISASTRASRERRRLFRTGRTNTVTDELPQTKTKSRVHPCAHACTQAGTHAATNSVGIDRCPPYLVVIYDCSSAEATVIWEMMAILIW